MTHQFGRTYKSKYSPELIVKMFTIDRILFQFTTLRITIYINIQVRYNFRSFSFYIRSNFDKNRSLAQITHI